MKLRYSIGITGAILAVLVASFVFARYRHLRVTSTHSNPTVPAESRVFVPETIVPPEEGSPVDTSKWSKYQNADFGIQLSLPPGFKIVDVAPGRGFQVTSDALVRDKLIRPKKYIIDGGNATEETFSSYLEESIRSTRIFRVERLTGNETEDRLGNLQIFLPVDTSTGFKAKAFQVLAETYLQKKVVCDEERLVPSMAGDKRNWVAVVSISGNGCLDGYDVLVSSEGQFESITVLSVGLFPISFLDENTLKAIFASVKPY